MSSSKSPSDINWPDHRFPPSYQISVEWTLIIKKGSTAKCPHFRDQIKRWKWHKYLRRNAYVPGMQKGTHDLVERKTWNMQCQKAGSYIILNRITMTGRTREVRNLQSQYCSSFTHFCIFSFGLQAKPRTFSIMKSQCP